MARERVTPEMRQLMNAMGARAREITDAAKRLAKVQNPTEKVALRHEIRDAQASIQSAARQLRQLKQNLDSTGDSD